MYRGFHPVVLTSAVAAVLLSGCMGELPTGSGVYYPAPGDRWDYREPGEVGMDADLLQQAVDFIPTALSREDRVQAFLELNPELRLPAAYAAEV